MHSAFQLPPVGHMPYIKCDYESQVNIPSPPSDYFVLDLSKKASKRPASPDYLYCYPSPKSSPNSDPSHDEYVSAKCCSESPNLDQAEVHSRLQSPPYDVSLNNNKEPHTSTVCFPLHSPRSPKSPGGISETTSETSSQSESTESRSPKSRRKITRPFKTLAKDSFALSSGAIEQLDSTLSTSTFLFDEKDLGPEATKRLMEESAKKYADFREKMLMQLHNNNNNCTNQNMRRMQNNGNRAQDPEYLEKRRKNNEAAKRSRDSRRYKQDEIAIRATFLEQENIMLKYKVQSEIEDLERLRKMEFSTNKQVSC